MKAERIQHVKDVIFTARILNTKDKTVSLRHEEAEELFELLQRFAWVNKNERLPASNMLCAFITVTRGLISDYTISRYDDLKQSQPHDIDYNYTHWMQLPLINTI